MIILAVIASALVGAMFWYPGMEGTYRVVKMAEPGYREKDPIADIRLEDKTILISLKGLLLDELEELCEMYEDTPLFPIIRQYSENARADEENAYKRGYIDKLAKIGYDGKLLESLSIGTLEKMVYDHI